VSSAEVKGCRVVGKQLCGNLSVKLMKAKMLVFVLRIAVVSLQMECLEDMVEGR
jgi:hypothetical protein